MSASCDCPLTELRRACREYFEWESMLFGGAVKMTQAQLDTAVAAFEDARDRIKNLIGE